MSENNISLEAKDQPFEATTYGGLLRIARENKELSIDQVSSKLRISQDQIEGLESDNYKVFPTPVYARAHLRSRKSCSRWQHRYQPGHGNSH